MKKENVIILVIVLVIGAILLINYLRDSGEADEVTLDCFAENSLIYVSRTCGHCANQKAILGGSFDRFNTIDCIDEPEACAEAEITGFPTWIINGKKIEGVRSIEQLKVLTGC